MTNEVSAELEQALVNLKQQKFAEVVKSCESVLRDQPYQADAYHLLGVATFKQGDPNRALHLLQSAIKYQPRQAQYYNSLGLVYSNLKLDKHAIRNFNKAINLHSKYAEAYHNVAFILFRNQQLDEAMRMIQVAVKIDPKNLLILSYLNQFKNEQRMDKKMIPVLLKICKLFPEVPESYLIRAEVLYRMGHFDESAKALESVLKIDPKNEIALINLGNYYVEQGLHEEANAYYKRVIDNNPDQSEAYFNYTSSKIFTKLEPEVELLENKLKEEGLEDKARCNYHFCLSKIYDDLGEFEKAFSHLEIANQLKGTNYDIEAMDSGVQKILDTFSAEYFKQHKPGQRSPDSPIFVFGMPRSGTSLVEQIISSHPGVYPAGEALAIPEVKAMLTRIFKSRDAYPQCATSFTEELLQLLRKAYYNYLIVKVKYPGKFRIVDKLLGNGLDLGLIYMMFPNAKFIYCRRNPMAVCMSIYRQRFIHDTGYENDLDLIAKHYLLYERIIQHWQKVLPTEIKITAYEDLIDDQKQVTEELLSFCGLEWDERCLEFYKNARHVQTASLIQVHQPIYKEAKDRWKNYQHHLGHLKDYFNF